LGSLRGPLSQIPLQKGVVVVVMGAAAAAVEVVVDEVGFSEWFGFGFWVYLNSNPLGLREGVEFRVWG